MTVPSRALSSEALLAVSASDRALVGGLTATLCSSLFTLWAALVAVLEGSWTASPAYFVLCLALGGAAAFALGAAGGALSSRAELAALVLLLANAGLAAPAWWIWRLDGPWKVSLDALVPALAAAAALLLAGRWLGAGEPPPAQCAAAVAGGWFLVVVMLPRALLAWGGAPGPPWLSRWVVPAVASFCLTLGLLGLGNRGERWLPSLGGGLLLVATTTAVVGLGALAPLPVAEWVPLARHFELGGGPRPSTPPADDPARPSVLLVVLDTVRADHLSLYGYRRPTTPWLEKRLRSWPGAVVFPRAYANGNWTVPSHASLFTGRLVSEHGADFGAGPVALPPGVPTLAEKLRERGYRTAGFSANPQLLLTPGLGRGFDVWRHPVPTHGLPDLGESLRARLLPGLFPEAVTGHPPAELVLLRAAQELIACGGRPCFVLANLFEPHARYAPRAPCRGRFAPWGLREPLELPLLSLGREGLARLETRYDEEVCSLDFAVGELFDELAARGWLQHNWLVITADHGEAFGEHGVSEHGTSLFDEEVRIPLIVVPPRGVSLAASPQPVSLVDLAATLAGITGVELATSGRDLRQPAAGPGLARLEAFGDPGKAPYYGALAALPARAVVAGRWKLVEHGGARALFDLEADPGETQDRLAAEPAVAAALAALLPPLARQAAPVSTPPLSPEAERRLRALGYLR